MAGRLVICPTPIGNLGDMTLRTLEELRAADTVCAEDTRVTGKLLAHFGIEKRLERLDEAAITRQAGRIAERIAAGETVAFCSDAGMPGVSDPGARLIEATRAAGGQVEVLPGASAAVTAYVASGFNNPRFFFGGFFPRKDAERRETLRALSSLDAVLMFYESPRRIVSALSAVAEMLPKREVAVCRELTKVHEEVARGPVSAILDEFARRDEEGGVKGEIVLVIGPATQAEEEERRADAASSAAARAAELIAQSDMTRKEIVKALRDEFGIPRNEAYDLVMKA
ncbi:MAG: 16S rRNA (cytidine(1402)-2'-O)-methyltransferase [Slackia sp.]|nr:16S rRNA (cytidine(1402)-2'-O)-methyltransferase [Slackia sp.]